MTFELFLKLYIIGSLLSGLFTQALKKTVPHISSNLVALFCSIGVGGLGMAVAYILLDIAFNLKTITSIVLMVFMIYLGAMNGYDKVMQTISQCKGE